MMTQLTQVVTPGVENLPSAPRMPKGRQSGGEDFVSILTELPQDRAEASTEKQPTPAQACRSHEPVAEKDIEAAAAQEAAPEDLTEAAGDTAAQPVEEDLEATDETHPAATEDPVEQAETSGTENSQEAAPIPMDATETEATGEGQPVKVKKVASIEGTDPLLVQDTDSEKDAATEAQRTMPAESAEKGLADVKGEKPPTPADPSSPETAGNQKTENTATDQTAPQSQSELVSAEPSAVARDGAKQPTPSDIETPIKQTVIPEAPESPPVAKKEAENTERAVRTNPQAPEVGSRQSSERASQEAMPTPEGPDGSPLRKKIVSVFREQPPRPAEQPPRAEPTSGIEDAPAFRTRAAHQQVQGKNFAFAAPQAAAEANAPSAVPATAMPGSARPLNAAHFVESVLRQARLLTRPDGSRELRIHLRPPELGSVLLRLTLRNDRLDARLQVETPATRAAMESLFARIKESLAGDGIDLQRFDVGLRHQAHHQTGREGDNARFTGDRNESPTAETGDAHAQENAASARSRMSPSAVMDFVA